MRHLDYRGIDVNKAALFVLLGLFIMITLIALVLVPDVRKLKVAHMGAERSAIVLSQARTNYQMNEALLRQAQEENRWILEVLGSSFDSQRLHQRTTGYFSRLEFGPTDRQIDGAFEVGRVRAVAQMSDPGSFYEFVQFLQRRERIVGLDFPIEIEAQGASRHLTWRFGLADYRRHEAK